MSLLLFVLTLAACDPANPTTAPLHRASSIPNQVDGVIWEAGNWDPHLPAGEAGVSWGNHRALVEVQLPPGEAVEAVRVTIPWRRPDPDPASRAVIVVDATTGEAVENVLVLRAERESGEILFQPNTRSSLYHVYYLPWQSTGGYYPTITYPTQAQVQAFGSGTLGGESPSRADAGTQARVSWKGRGPNPDPQWLAWARSVSPPDLIQAETTHIQSVDEFHSFFPMEVLATAREYAAFMEGATQGWRVVPEHRDYPIRMRHFIPRHWAVDPAVDPPAPPDFRSRVLRDEAFTVQLGLVSGDAPLHEVQVAIQGFPDSWQETFTCFNCRGVDEKGEAFSKTLHVPRGTVQPLWLGFMVPRDEDAGTVEGTITVSTANRGSQTVSVVLEVDDARAENHGFDEPELQGRLFWLNSTVGTDPDFIIEPFEAVGVVEGSGEASYALTILGRRIELSPTGLPHQIYSFFTPELTGLAPEPEPILARPVEISVRTRDGGQGARTSPESTMTFRSEPYRITQPGQGRATWRTESRSQALDMTVAGELEYDGMLAYRITLVARESVAVEDIALPVSLVPGAAEYMLGLGRKGGKRPDRVDWKWAVENHQEGVWLGAVHKGLQYVLRDENYVRPLNTNFYRNQPLNLPPSWYNGGRGGIRVYEEADGVTAYNYSGPRTLSAGDTLHFNIRFLITPFKPIDTTTHFNTRFVHQYVPVDSVVAWGGTVVNIHHANEINPYINYPFFNLDLQKAYIQEAHAKGVKVKLYNTIRELTYKAHELFSLRSLGDEILNDGEGGGHSWMQEHLRDHYHSAWHAWRVDDAAMLNKGTSRWTNYYVEGLNWLADRQEIDGLYLDDIAFSRETVKRIVTVLHAHRDDPVIDLHSANQFNVRDGFINSAMLYMEHFPFINRLWFGEYFEYDLDPDYWMTEVSGLPFGLMGEMLQDGGHPYRGMLYGMTARKYGDTDPRPVWAMMNDFGIAESRMLGYWLKDAPVRTGHPEILATTYVGDESTLISLASWSAQDEVVELTVDWAQLGFPDATPGEPGGGTTEGRGGLGIAIPADLRIHTPAVAGLQDEAEVDLSALRIPAGMGLWVVVEGG